MAFEVIVVDNGSTDQSRGVAERFGMPVQVVDESAVGGAQARNAGVRIASGDLIAFLDADDLWEAPKLAHQVDIFNSQPEMDLVFTRMQDFVSPELTPQQKAGLMFRSGEYAGLSPSSMMVRARSFHSVGPFPNLAVGEFIAWYGLAQTAGLKSHIIPELLVKRRVHQSNTTRVCHSKDGYVTASKMVLDARRSQKQAREAEWRACRRSLCGD